MLRRVFCKLLLVAVLVFSFLAFSGVLFAQGRSEEALEHAKAVQEKHTDALMAKPDVLGTAVGLNDQGTYDVVVLLEKGGVPGIPQEFEGVPVRPLVTGKIYALAKPENPGNGKPSGGSASSTSSYWWPRPVPIGVSTGNAKECAAGTISCRVKDTSGNVYALSNNHVYARQNKASLGEEVMQPGLYDAVPQCSYSQADVIGNLADFEPIVFSRYASNVIDAAIASTTVNDLGVSTPTGDGYGTPSSNTITAYLGQGVQKYGRTTSLTTGTVTGVNATVLVSYGSGKTARFVKQIVITPGSFSAAGDSGSLIVDMSNNPVGLLFAGSSSDTIANPIGDVLDYFGVSIDNSSGGGTTNTPPIASFTANPTSGNAPLTVSFDASGSYDQDGNIKSYAWNFGDGNTGSGVTINHTYTAAGTYTVKLTVTDNGGANGTNSQSITVSSGTGGTMHISAINMSYSKSRRNYSVYTKVTIVNESNSPVSHATVYLTMTLPNNSTASGHGDTGTDGSVTFVLTSRQTGTYTSEVTNVTHATLSWDGVTAKASLKVP
jgi:PKD repeat protein